MGQDFVWGKKKTVLDYLMLVVSEYNVGFSSVGRLCTFIRSVSVLF